MAQQIDFSKMNKDQLLELYQKETAARQQKTAQPQQNDVMSMVNRLAPKPSIRTNIADAMSVLGGGKPIVNSTDTLDRMHKAAQIEALTNKQNTLIPIMDASGNITGYQHAPTGNIKFAPSGYSESSQDKNRATAEAARAGIPLKEQQAESFRLGNNMMQGFLDNQQGGVGGEGGVTPGTVAKVGNLTFPLNPKLTEVEQGSVSGAEKFEPLVQQVQDLIGTGILDSGKSREYTQFLAEGGGSPLRRMMTEDNSPLEKLASARQELIKYAFSEGGKTLSPTELPIVKAGLDFMGKSDDQIIHDFGEAVRILKSKRNLALGGRNAALNGQQTTQIGTNDLSQLSDEELQAIAGGGQ